MIRLNGNSLMGSTQLIHYFRHMQGPAHRCALTVTSSILLCQPFSPYYSYHHLRIRLETRVFARASGNYTAIILIVMTKSPL